MTQPSQDKPATESSSAGAGPYEIAPSEDAERGFPAPAILHGFDESTDFEDPGNATASEAVADGAVPGEPALVQAGKNDAAILAGIAGLVMLAGALVAGVFSQGSSLGAGLLAIMHAGVYLSAGLGALGMTAYLRGRPVGEWGPGVARVFLASAVFEFVVQLRLPIFGWWSGFVVFPLAIGLYVTCVVKLFRWAKEAWVVFVISHATLAAIARLCLSLYAALTASATDATPP
jgi:hypothetical protein